jgi:antitoxin component of MazEF toxin-antitoxin module
MLQNIIQIGNSTGITLSKNYLQAMGISAGDKIETTFDPQAQQILISIPKQKKKNTQNDKLSHEFQVWLNNFLEEDADLLDELASR